MKYFYILILITVNHGVIAEEVCPGGQWTPQTAYEEGCEEYKCFKRELYDKNGKLCARILDIIKTGEAYFTAMIYDPSGKLHAMERYFVNPNGKGALRVEVTNSNGDLLYYLDKDENALLPSGKMLPDNIPNPADKFYELVINPNYTLNTDAQKPRAR